MSDRTLESETAETLCVLASQIVRTGIVDDSGAELHAVYLSPDWVDKLKNLAARLEAKS